MENTTAEILHKPGLTIKQILVTAEIPVHPAFRDSGFDYTVNQKASFYVDTETWECSGEVSGHPVMAEEQWWKEQCQRVSDRVRAGLTNLSV